MILNWDCFVIINCLIDCNWAMANCVAMVATLPFYYIDCPIEILSVFGYSDTSHIFIC